MTNAGTEKDRVLSGAELQALGKALRETTDAQRTAATVVRLIALTGLRKNEACALRWSEVDDLGKRLMLAKTKTGRSNRPIGRAALLLLRSLPRGGNDFLFPDATGKRNVDLKKKIEQLFDSAGLTDARSQDLRRTFATVAAQAGSDTGTIGQLLGHKQRGVTEKHYIWRPDWALASAADRASARIAAMLDDELGEAEVVPLQEREYAAQA